MKLRQNKYKIFMLLSIISVAITLFAQPIQNTEVKEQLYLITDRDLYCVDETIFFTIFQTGYSKPSTEN
jgi:hypothetical protein